MVELLWLIELVISGFLFGGVLVSYIEGGIFSEMSPDAYLSYLNWEQSMDGVLNRLTPPLGLLWTAALVGLLQTVESTAFALLVGALIGGGGFFAVMAKMQRLFCPKVEDWHRLHGLRIRLASTAFALSLFALLSTI